MTHGRAWVMFACLASIPAAQAHAAEIRYDPSTRVFELSAQQVTYAFGVNERGELRVAGNGARVVDQLRYQIIGRAGDHCDEDAGQEQQPSPDAELLKHHRTLLRRGARISGRA